MKEYEFTITISGVGENIEEAWEDAVQTLAENPESAPTHQKKETGETEYFVFLGNLS